MFACFNFIRDCGVGEVRGRKREKRVKDVGEEEDGDIEGDVGEGGDSCSTSTMESTYPDFPEVHTLFPRPKIFLHSRGGEQSKGECIL